MGDDIMAKVSIVSAKVRALVDYAAEKRLSVPVETRERWQVLIKNGESENKIRDYIDKKSKEIKGSEKEPEVKNFKDRSIGINI